MQLFIYCKITLHVSGVYRTHHQELLGYLHRGSLLIRSNEMQQYEGVYLLQNYSKCFGCLSHQLLGEHKTVTAASGTGHSISATNLLRRGLIRPRRMMMGAIDTRNI